MTVNVAIQMDPVAAIDIVGDSTFALGLEAQRRGYNLFYYQPETLELRGRTVTAPLQPLTLADRIGAHFTLGDAHKTDLREMDVVLMRQDPPFDMAYISATHMLELVHPDTLVVNDPVAVRNAPEKLLPTLFPDLQPPTLITRNVSALADFRKEFSDIILKPLYGNGGAGVFRVQPADENFAAMVEMFLANSREPIVAQQYLPEIRQGDKRVILVEGEAVGALNRVPLEGEARANVHAGGVPTQSGLSERDIEIAAQIGPYLKKNGIILAGIDVIGDYLTEINVTSPTCLREIKGFGGPDIAADVWDAIEARRQK